MHPTLYTPCNPPRATTTAYRMDLAAARGSDPVAREAEKKRFLQAITPLVMHDGLTLLVTDSQVGGIFGQGTGLMLGFRVWVKKP